MITVMHKEKLYKLNFTYDLFHLLKNSNPDLKVELSSMEEPFTGDELVKLREIQDWSSNVW